MIRHSFYLLLLALCASCTDLYRLPEGEQSVIVITGLVTNEAGPYFVKIMENTSDLTTFRTVQRGIDDARVTITCSDGNVDELRSIYSLAVDSMVIDSTLRYEPDRDVKDRAYEYVYSKYINIPDGNGGYIRFFLFSYSDIREGVYFTTSTKGVPGRAYTLKVEYAGQEYTATDYMCRGTVIDSVSVEPLGRYIYDKPDGSDGFMVPCLYFAEPKDEVNFYMFKAADYGYSWDSEKKQFVWVVPPARHLSLTTGQASDWYISVVSDRFFPAYVSRYKMSDGDSSRKYYSGTDMGFYERWENGGSIDMYCITEPVYRYYCALSQQYHSDGGAFSASPASPPANISGGAQGCFSAASVSQYTCSLNTK